MRITKIALKNFRAFYADHEIDLGKRGRNLLVYGENGSGKSSLLKAIELFIDSHVRNYSFTNYRNFHFTESDGGYVKISMRATKNDPETTYEWSDITQTTETSNPLIIQAAKTRGSLDYKSLLKVYFLTPDNSEIDLFNLLIEEILNNTRNNFTDRLLREEWEEIKNYSIPRSAKHTKKIQELQSILDNFNDGLDTILQLLKDETIAILNKFGYSITLDFIFRKLEIDLPNKRLAGGKVYLQVHINQINFTSPHQFLNEAKLSAIALSIYLAALKNNPSSILKVLVLDDVLIGLDMSNRIPVIDILKEKFSDYQIFLMTYDKEWYELLKRHFNNWKTIELYAGKGIDYEIPILVEHKKYLDKAQHYLEAHDHAAAAVYLRKAFEVKIKSFCEKMNLRVKYRERPKDLDTNDFWEPIINAENLDGTPKNYISTDLISLLEQHRTFIMNPLSHATLATAPTREIQDAIDTMRQLENELDAIVNSQNSSP
jgi:energy-coupling factor transporter ATP-binding protein EcfA2